eukprot:gene2532-727_t
MKILLARSTLEFSRTKRVLHRFFYQWGCPGGAPLKDYLSLHHHLPRFHSGGAIAHQVVYKRRLDISNSKSKKMESFGESAENHPTSLLQIKFLESTSDLPVNPKKFAMKSRRGVMQELHFLLKNVEFLTEGQCKITDIDESGKVNALRFVVKIVPDSGPYRFGKFDFLFKVTRSYPTICPDIRCLTHIYHPNIDESGEICLSLFEDWSPEYNCLMHCVYGLLFLLKNPNLDDPLSPYFCPEDANCLESFHENVRKSLEGGVVDGFITFERNLVDKKDYKE